MSVAATAPPKVYVNVERFVKLTNIVMEGMKEFNAPAKMLVNFEKCYNITKQISELELDRVFISPLKRIISTNVILIHSNRRGWMEELNVKFYLIPLELTSPFLDFSGFFAWASNFAPGDITHRANNAMDLLNEIAASHLVRISKDLLATSHTTTTTTTTSSAQSEESTVEDDQYYGASAQQNAAAANPLAALINNAMNGAGVSELMDDLLAAKENGVETTPEEFFEKILTGPKAQQIFSNLESQMPNGDKSGIAMRKLAKHVPQLMKQFMQMQAEGDNDEQTHSETPEPPPLD